jgi:hypothetical protein
VTALAYAACFLALAALAGIAVTDRGSWLARAPLLALTPVLAIAVWWQLSQRDGWPMSARPANGSLFLASIVQSPAPGSAGAIYVWAQTPGSTTPRAYRMPYDPKLEQQVARAAHASRSGARVGIRTGHPGHSGRRGSPQQSSQAQLHFYKLPPPAAPEKNAS